MRFTALLALLVFSGAYTASGLQNQTDNRQRDLMRVRPTGTPVKPPDTVPRGYALIIGIGSYKNIGPSGDLRFTESDAEGMYRVLISQEAGAFPPENVHKLIGKDATIANIRHEMEEWLPSVAKPDDRVIVYFAGHGVVDQGHGYLPAYDVNPQAYLGTAYPMSTLGDVLANKVKAHWKVLLVDTCHSGHITTESTDEAVDAALKKMPRDFLTLTATTERESSWESSGLGTGAGVFTYFLKQAWEGYADNDPCDGVLTAHELIEYVRTGVMDYVKTNVAPSLKRTADDKPVTQTPQALGDYDPHMVLGINRSCIGTASPNSSVTGTAVIEANMDAVDVYVDGKFVGKVDKGQAPLRMPLSLGLHKVDGVRQGYETDHKEVMIAPGQDAPVTLRIRYAKSYKKSAVDFNSQGEKLLNTHRSSLNLFSIEGAPKQTRADLERARDLFARALKDDPTYGTAAFNLGQAGQMLDDEDGSLKAYQRALEIDPSYVDARLQLAAVLIENGDADAAIRLLTDAIRLEPKNDQVYSMIARAFLDKGVWNLCLENANRAIGINQSNEQAHLWKAEATRQLAAPMKKGPERTRLYQQARDDYKAFLDLTNYSTPVYSWIAFHFIGFGLGSRHHADRSPAYQSQRSTGFLGLCLCDQSWGDLRQGLADCQQAVKADGADPMAFFELGNVYRDLYNANSDKGVNRCDYLQSARDNYAKMIQINGDMAEARNAKNYIEQIDGFLPKVKKAGCSTSPGV